MCQPLPSWLLVTNSTPLPARVNSLVGAGKTISLEGSWAPPSGSDGKESTCNVGDLGLIPGLGRSPGGGHGNPLQYSCLENPHTQRSLVGYSPWGRKESDPTEQLNTAQHREKLGNQNAQRRIKDLGKYEGSEQMEYETKETAKQKHSLPLPLIKPLFI